MMISDKNIVAEIRMPDCDGNPCLTFILDKQGNVSCWSEFGDPVHIDIVHLEMIAIALENLKFCCPKKAKP
jgi:hypothetical protein